MDVALSGLNKFIWARTQGCALGYHISAFQADASTSLAICSLNHRRSFVRATHLQPNATPFRARPGRHRARRWGSLAIDRRAIWSTANLQETSSAAATSTVQVG